MKTSIVIEHIEDINLDEVEKIALDLNNSAYDSEKNSCDLTTVGYNFFINGKWRSLSNSSELEKNIDFRNKIKEIFEEEPEVSEENLLLFYTKKTQNMPKQNDAESDMGDSEQSPSSSSDHTMESKRTVTKRRIS